jgi:PAS domain S-box-containing protein
LQKSHTTQFEAIFKYASEGILTTDRLGVIRTVNPAACKLFQYAEKELIDEKIEQLIPRRYTNHVSHREKFVQNPRARSMATGLDLFALKKNGDEFPVEVSLSPYVAEGQTFVIAFIIDITVKKEIEEREKNYRKELEREVGDRTLILKEAIQKLEKTKANLDLALQREKEANMVKSRFVSIASHEFRTPLSTMLSSLVLIEKYAAIGELDKQEKHVDRIKKSIRLLTEILNDILSINKLEEGVIIPRSRAFEFFPFIQNIVSDLSLILKTNQTINLKFNANEALIVNQDETLFRHVITNLLSNALKFSLENTEVEVSVEEDKEKVKIKIKDQGIGIPEANIKQLFTRFYRADNAGQIQGTGLGLSIVKQYVELIGGRVGVSSKQGQGSTFEVSIPKILIE